MSKYGIIPQKTFSAYLPNNVDNKYMRHLIRGLIDGDGNIISKYLNNGKHRHCISLCGTHKLMEDVANYLKNELNVNNTKIYDYKNNTLSEVKWQKRNDIYRIGNWMYNDSKIFLKRKRKKFDDFINYYLK